MNSTAIPAALDPAAVATLTAALKGKRLEKFRASVTVINDSLAAGGWTVPRGNDRA